MGPALLLDSARLRKQLTRDAALQLFSGVFEPSCLSVEESFRTYFDTLEGHWSWWVRVEGHFVKIPPEKKTQCDRDVRAALQALSEPRGIPYTIHELHVQGASPQFQLKLSTPFYQKPSGKIVRSRTHAFFAVFSVM